MSTTDRKSTGSRTSRKAQTRAGASETAGGVSSPGDAPSDLWIIRHQIKWLFWGKRRLWGQEPPAQNWDKPRWLDSPYVAMRFATKEAAREVIAGSKIEMADVVPLAECCDARIP